MSSSSPTPSLAAEKIHLIEVRILHGSLDSDAEPDKVIEDFQVEVDLELGFNLEQKIAKTEFKVEVIGKTKEGESCASGAFHFNFFFAIENLQELVIPREDGSIQIDSGLGNALASITYSTSRGILMTRFQGTALSDFLLPVINPNELLKNYPSEEAKTQ